MSTRLHCALVVALLAGCSADDPGLLDAGPGDGLKDYLWLYDGPRPDGPPPPTDLAAGEAGAPSHAQLAAHWAPVWYHDSDSSNYKGDYIVAYDFDGDTRSDNNWDNLNKAGVDLRAVIYYSVVETQTHWFMLYADFHPQDWDENCQPIPFGPDRCHENDMEGAMVVVRKDGSARGTFELLYTEAHNALHIFTNDKTISAASTTHLESAPVTWENGSHPELYVESKGHGVCALRYNGSEHCKHPVSGNPPPFPGGDGLVFRYKGVAQTPKSGNDRDVGYALVPLETTLWARRKDICDSGCTFDTTMTFEGQTVGKAFDGDNHGDDKANPPWAWDDPDDGAVYRGSFFFRPAEMVLTHLKVSGAWSKTYLVNPFLSAK